MGKAFVSGGAIMTAPSAGTPISDVAVGSALKLNVNGVAKEFLVVHQGNPDSSLYDSSCDGVWLLMKDLFDQSYFNNPYDICYEGSDLDAFLNDTFYNALDIGIRSLIKTVKVPYITGELRLCSGANGHSTKVFALSDDEVGLVTSSQISCSPYADGARLNYFIGATTATRVAYYNGEAEWWWLRTPCGDSEDYLAHCITATGGYSDAQTVNLNYTRPAFILPDTVLVAKDGTIKI